MTQTQQAVVNGTGIPTDSRQLLDFVEKELYTAVLSDALDDAGYRDQAMREYIRPLPGKDTFAGWARTMLCIDVYSIGEEPYAKEIEALDSVLPDEVLVVSTGKSVRNAPWGELLSTAATARGARGAVIDGLVRDVRKIQQLGFPVFAAGIKPVDSKGRGMVLDYNVPIHCGEVQVQPGDLIVADYDGVVCVPAAILPQVVASAYDKVTRENGTRADLMSGSYLRDVFAKYGVL
jgi:4-hydroxy-4-methyl-2-oxoglutarate aldolase